MNYIDDIAATLRRVSVSLHLLSEEEKKRLAEYMRKSDPNFVSILGQLEPKSLAAWLKSAPSPSSAPESWAAASPTPPRSADIAPSSKTFCRRRLRKAETEIRANLDKAVELGKVTPDDADAGLPALGVRLFGRAGRPRGRPRDRGRARGDGVQARDLHPARQGLPAHHHHRVQHFFAQHHRNFFRHLSRAPSASACTSSIPCTK